MNNKEQGKNNKSTGLFIFMAVIIVVLAVALVVTNQKKEKESSLVSNTTEIKEERSTQEEITQSETKEDTEEKLTSDQTGYIITYSSQNTWENNGVQMCGLEIGIQNATDANIEGWTLTLEIEELKSCEGWNGVYEVKGNTLTITNEDYNGNLTSNQTITIGCNVGTASNIQIKSAKLNGRNSKSK